MDRNKAWQAWILTSVLAFSFLISFTSARAAAPYAGSLCGDGSAPDYGLTYDLQQPHWTVDWENYVSEQSVNEVDRVLDRLNGDSIAQTMILFQSQDQVGIRTNCAVHFLRYMQLGLPTGERKDNGFVFLIVVENNSIDVHYAVGLGLPALTANELTNINRATEDSYDSTKSMDQALLTLVNEFDKVARSNYEPLVTVAPTPEDIELPSGPAGILIVCCLTCLVILFVLFLIWILSQAGRGGGGGMFTSSGSRSSWGRGFPSGGFSSNRGRSSPPSRGGSGSGRSGRTN
ncbi:MAG: hypothetical protein JNM55_08155 [Anaerolineales bacterium]|nr:hypothetical protein [Anaerolineales bacterium]